MEQIETQASDLRYLSRAPAAPLLSGIHMDHPYDGGGNSALVEAEAGQDGQDGQDEQDGQDGRGLAAVNNNNNNNNHSNSHKRKSEERGGGRQTRSKRNRYISIACNECKRRKIKCNGETPCQRCGNLNLECLYTPNCCPNSFKDSEDFRVIVAQLGRLQDDVHRLNQTVHALQTDAHAHANAYTRPPPSAGLLSSSVPPSEGAGFTPSLAPSTVFLPQPDPSSSARFSNTTSAAYCLDVANATMSRMGWRTGEDAEEETETPPLPPPPAHPSHPSHPAHPAHPARPVVEAGADPLLELDEAELYRLCKVHAEEFEALHPMIQTQDVVAHIKNIAPHLDYLRRQRSLEPVNDDQTLQLKIAICCALVVENDGRSYMASRLYDSMEAVLNRKLMLEPPDINTLPTLATLGGYHFLTCDAVLAWRTMGQVVRLCMEFGLHQRAGFDSLPSEALRNKAADLFWSVYILERRWSFDAGLPFVAQDEDLDPELPMPPFPFSAAMLHFSRLCGKVWRQATHFGHVLSREVRSQEIESLDREISAWYDSVPETLKLPRDWKELETELTEPSPASEAHLQQRLQIWTYLRWNQIRIWLYIAVLHSATNIMANLEQAHRVVDLAKDTIQFLSLLDKKVTHYRKVYYHQFLGPSIAAMFLACVHAPMRFVGICRPEFYMALEICKGLSARNIISQKLWRAVRTLKNFAPRIGLNPEQHQHQHQHQQEEEEEQGREQEQEQEQEQDPHSTAAALGMIGLARGHMEAESQPLGQASYSPPSPSQSQSQSQSQGHDLAMLMNPPRKTRQQARETQTDLGDEFSRMFESYLGMKGAMTGGSVTSGPVGAPFPMPPGMAQPACQQLGDTFYSSFMREML